MPHSEEEYQQLGALLDSLIDEVRENESHALASLMEIVGVLISDFTNSYNFARTHSVVAKLSKYTDFTVHS